ncbi:MAG: Asp-tRNA(Asn)/Glu-tRNA(Gln) amidotransferase subunit GatB [Myxococcaceae bacterium]
MSVSDFQPVIGLEVHAQLLTRSKIFSGAATTFGEKPNSSTRPLCLGMPGTLPVLNKAAVAMAVKAGLAVGCTIRETSVFARKHYFYPDLPKGYQITQYELPICEHGVLEISAGEGATKPIRILRIHMEEDAGKSVHDAGGGSLVDLNRAGTPLIEIVSQPDLRSADEAVEYLKALREILIYVGVNDGNLEEGSFRCDANVSVMRKGAEKFGTRCELKNLNSFRFIKAAIDVEIARHVELIEGGGAITQETRLYDPDRNETRSMRSKEDAQDYRYFPDPDLPPLVLLPSEIDAIRHQLPELPKARRARWVSSGLSEYDANTLAQDKTLADFFDAAAKDFKGEPKKVANWCLGEVSRLMKTAALIKPAQLAALLGEVEAGRISANAGKDVLGQMFATGEDAAKVIADKGLAQVTDTGATEAAVDEVIARHPTEVASFKSGKQQVLGFLVGQVMKAMKGKGNPKLVNELLKQKLG